MTVATLVISEDEQLTAKQNKAEALVYGISILIWPHATSVSDMMEHASKIS